MKKEDVKSGMVVKLRRGCWCLVVKFEGKLLLVNSRDCETNMSEFNDDLTDDEFDEFDIIAVAKTEPCNLIALNKSEFDIIWEREGYTEMTLSEIEEKLGFKIKIV